MESTRSTRRQFLGGLAGVLVTAGLGVKVGEARQIDGVDLNLEAEKIPRFKNKDEYIKYIKPLADKYLKVVEENDILDGYKKISKEKRVKAFEMYFPMYYAAQLEYGVPWVLLFLTHAHETAFSTNERPDGLWTRGAMQRSPKFYPDSAAVGAAKNWVFLKDLDQRYLNYPDYQEILFAGMKLNEDGKVYFGGDSVKAMTKYCNKDIARERINQYEKIKLLFN